jgi:hypothetical protein
VGPWVPTGRYIHRAIAGQMNFHIVIKKDMSAESALKALNRYYLPHFAITEADFSIVNGIISVKYAPAPKEKPSDGVGPRPKRNDGV